MKITVVPAQVTTVEDRIMGSLGFSQMLLLVCPVFISALLFAGLPPFMEGAWYKYVLIGVLTVLCCILAIRIKGKIVALWLVTILRYNLRPKYYLFNKNTVSYREMYAQSSEADDRASNEKSDAREHHHLPKLALPDKARVLAAIENPASKLRFETTKKGGIHVRLTEIEEQNI